MNQLKSNYHIIFLFNVSVNTESVHVVHKCAHVYVSHGINIVKYDHLKERNKIK